MTITETAARVICEITPSDVYAVIDCLDREKKYRGRTQARNTIVAPVVIETGNGTIISATTRDNSRTSLGLIHLQPIPCEEVVVHVGTGTIRHSYRFLVKWCRQIESSLFASGGYFVH